MATEKEIQLVTQLLEKTRKRSLTWEPTASDDEYVSTLGGNVSFTVSSWRGKELLTMRDQLDRVLLTIDSYTVAQVSELYAEARRLALKVDESLDNVLNTLERME